MTIVNNPAGLARIGDRLDVGLTLFNPIRDSRIQGNANPAANRSYHGNQRRYFLIPDISYAHQVNDRFGLGVALYGNGGLNTGYKDNPFGAYGSKGSAGVDLTQIFLTPAAAWRVSDGQYLGLGLNLVRQRFRAKGLSAFDNPGFTDEPGHLSNRHHDTSTGWGPRLGWQGQINDNLSLGLSWSSKIRMGKFHRYGGLFAAGGSFDIPENYSAGLAYRLTPKFTTLLDIQKINYGNVRSVGKDLNIRSVFAGGRFGAKNGPGFGWRNIRIYKIGANYQLDPKLILRAGFSHAEQPIKHSQTFLNILAPGVIQNHASLGLTWQPELDQELNLAYTHGFQQTIHGHGSIPAAFGGGEARVRMRQDIFSAGYSWKL